ncbi:MULTISPECIES: hypothetical protein [unclassified Bradyrhizobium]|jgi:hypothetical protein|nr:MULTISPECIES: hypothetical protein [unclassified Bradyrhizobium]
MTAETVSSVETLPSGMIGEAVPSRNETERVFKCDLKAFDPA